DRDVSNLHTNIPVSQKLTEHYHIVYVCAYSMICLTTSSACPIQSGIPTPSNELPARKKPGISFSNVRFVCNTLALCPTVYCGIALSHLVTTEKVGSFFIPVDFSISCKAISVISSSDK